MLRPPMADRRGRTSIRAAAPFLAALLVLAGCGSTPTPSVTTTAISSPAVTTLPSIPASVAPPSLVPSPSAPPAETEPVGAAQCEPADLKASHGLVEGAAGSRLTTVELVAAVACSVDLYPAFALIGAHGTVLVGGASQGPGRVDLVAGESYESNVRLANWCGDDPPFPLNFKLHIGTETEDVTGGSFPEEGDLPPCNGDTQGPILEATPWDLAP